MQVEVGSGLAFHLATEGLLAHDRPGGLVVDVEVAGCILQGAHGVVNGVTLAGEDGSGQGVFARAVHHPSGVKVFSRVDVQGHHRSEDFLSMVLKCGVLARTTVGCTK